MILLRPAILLHGALAVAAFFIALTTAARLDGPLQPAAAVGATRPAQPLYDSEALDHAEAVYRTRRYAEAEDALRCAGFRAIDATRGSRVVVPGRDYEVAPHPAVRHAAQELQRHGTGAGLCGHLQQPSVQQWYRVQFRL